ncbi:hypothetical protein D6C81_04359 [Aureobasidium pullulans]|nr:hypothetical protein D6C81_04359 [Aureobasidium pullulans]
MSDAHAPLTWETSTHTQPQLATSLPSEVVNCLENARYLHLATCTELQPHVALMNYTYLPSHPFADSSSQMPSGPVIIMTSNPASRKTVNLTANPNVSLLVHDWVSHRPATNHRNSSPEGRRAPGRSSLASLLMGMNTTQMGSISATINGNAIVLPVGSEEERWCKLQHLENNTFEREETSQNVLSATPSNAEDEEASRQSFLKDEDIRVVVVRIREGRIADWKGGVKDWVLAPAEGAGNLVNGL